MGGLDSKFVPSSPRSSIVGTMPASPGAFKMGSPRAYRITDLKDFGPIGLVVDKLTHSAKFDSLPAVVRAIF